MRHVLAKVDLDDRTQLATSARERIRQSLSSDCAIALMTAPRGGPTFFGNQPEESLMAICNIIDSLGRTAEQLELISAHVRSTGPVPPEGCRLALLGKERGITVWDSPDDRERFLAERLAPAYQAAASCWTISGWIQRNERRRR